MKKYSIALAFVLIAAVFAGCTQIDDTGLKTFSSEAELKEYLKQNTIEGGSFGSRNVQTLEAVADASTAPKIAADYSGTNVQVEGVDEADIVKSDGKYIYILSQGFMFIVNAYPAEDAQIVSNITLNGTGQEMFINGDKAIIFGYQNYPAIKPVEEMEAIKISMPVPGYYQSPKMFIKIFDITDRSNPSLFKELIMDGNYYDARMIGDYVYSVSYQPVNLAGDTLSMPASYESGVRKEIYSASDISYFPYPDYSYQFTDIASINIETGEIKHNPYMLGTSQTIYVSENNIYLTSPKQVNYRNMETIMLEQVIIPMMPSHIASQINEIWNSDSEYYEKQAAISDVLSGYTNSLSAEERNMFMKDMEQKYSEIVQRMEKDNEKTVIHKISINEGNVQYTTKGEVPGYPLNQFSMDENGDNFRIATTTGSLSGVSKNHIYVLDASMNTVGTLEDLAAGERIYSVRFLGDRGYMVTFRNVDPLFVIDLSNPAKPAVLGELKIPGVSDYMQMYDENTIIGIGRATEDDSGRTLFSGLKISLFDVSDVSKPIEKAKYEIGDRGTYSEALYEHKSILFDRQRNLLVLPVQLMEGRNEWGYGNLTFSGAYVFNMSTDGITLKGRITHIDKLNETYRYNGQVKRSLYMDDVLYTISDTMLKASSLATLDEIIKIDIPFAEPVYAIYDDAVAAREAVI